MCWVIAGVVIFHFLLWALLSSSSRLDRMSEEIENTILLEEKENKDAKI